MNEPSLSPSFSRSKHLTPEGRLTDEAIHMVLLRMVDKLWPQLREVRLISGDTVAAEYKLRID